MASHDSLPADQRAILQLLLKQHKSYADLAALLKTDTTGVRRRAHAAIDALGPAGADVGPDRRHEIADYLLGQQSASQRAATREYLEDSAAGRAWARATAGALRPLAGDALPDVPAEPEEVHAAFDALERRAARRVEVQRSSRLGGIVIIVTLGVVLALVLIFALGGGDDKRASTAGTASTATTAPVQADGEPVPIALVGLRPPPARPSKAKGTGLIVRFKQSGRLRLAVTANGLRQAGSGRAHGVWLYNSPTQAQFVGFVDPAVPRSGHLEAGSDIPAGTERARELLITIERVQRPARPGPVVLRGRFISPQQAQQGRTGTTAGG